MRVVWAFVDESCECRRVEAGTEREGATRGGRTAAGGEGRERSCEPFQAGRKVDRASTRPRQKERSVQEARKAREERERRGASSRRKRFAGGSAGSSRCDRRRGLAFCGVANAAGARQTRIAEAVSGSCWGRRGSGPVAVGELWHAVGLLEVRTSRLSASATVTALARRRRPVFHPPPTPPRDEGCRPRHRCRLGSRVRGGPLRAMTVRAVIERKSATRKRSGSGEEKGARSERGRREGRGRTVKFSVPSAHSKLAADGSFVVRSGSSQGTEGEESSASEARGGLRRFLLVLRCVRTIQTSSSKPSRPIVPIRKRKRATDDKSAESPPSSPLNRQDAA